MNKKEFVTWIYEYFNKQLQSIVINKVIINNVELVRGDFIV